MGMGIAGVLIALGALITIFETQSTVKKMEKRIQVLENKLNKS